jgi:hypothetical protein
VVSRKKSNDDAVKDVYIVLVSTERSFQNDISFSSILIFLIQINDLQIIRLPWTRRSPWIKQSWKGEQRGGRNNGFRKQSVSVVYRFSVSGKGYLRAPISTVRCTSSNVRFASDFLETDCLFIFGMMHTMAAAGGAAYKQVGLSWSRIKGWSIKFKWNIADRDLDYFAKDACMEAKV